MNSGNLLRILALSALLGNGMFAQQQPSEPYRGQTELPNNAAANDQPNTAAPGSTPETNSTMQPAAVKEGNLGFNPGWLGFFGLAGLFGLRRGNTESAHSIHHTHNSEMHRG